VLRLFYSLILFSTLISCGKDAQEIEFLQIDTRTTQDLSGIDKFDNKLIVVGGEVFTQGIVLEGKDSEWTILDTFSDKRLFGLCCHETSCIAVGQDGYLYHYSEEDGWSFERLPGWDFQRSVSKTAAHTVSVSGKSFEKGLIYHMTPEHVLDTVISIDAQLQDVSALDENTFIAVGYGTILKSSDGGYNWAAINQEGDFYHSVDFIDAHNGIIVGQAGSILLTDDGGVTWNTIKKPASLSSNRSQFLSVKYMNSSTIYIVGDEGLLWKSEDKGQSWNSFKVNTNHNLNGVAELDGTIYIVGDDGYLGKQKN